MKNTAPNADPQWKNATAFPAENRREANSRSGYVIPRKATLNGACDFPDDLSNSDSFSDDVVDTRRSVEGCRIDTRAGSVGQPSVARICDDPEQLLDTMASDRRDDPELGKVRADRVDDGSLLADEEMPGAMKRQTALLFGRLGWHEPHVWPGHRLANRFRVGGIVLLSLDIGLHIGRRHQAYRVAERLKFTRPMM